MTKSLERLRGEVLQGTEPILVFLDCRVQDLEVILEAILPGAIAHVLYPEEDALATITQLLTETGAKRLAIVAHGEPGVVQIGTNPLNLEQLQAQA
ncbi:MAG TPA: DUF4347 domain-containing protein, partial [Thermosynechococcaceae cyanobacterium]